MSGRCSVNTVIFLPWGISARSSISTARLSPALTKNRQRAGGPDLNSSKFAEPNGVIKPSATAQILARLANTCRSTGESKSKLAASRQSYLDLTRPKSTAMRAIPPRPLVSKTIGCSRSDNSLRILLASYSVLDGAWVSIRIIPSTATASACNRRNRKGKSPGSVRGAKAAT